MPRTLSPAGMNALMAEVTNEAFLLLMEFTYVPDTITYRVVLNTEDVTSNGDVYTATYFEFQLPDVTAQGPQGCRVSMDNIGLEIVQLLRSITEPLRVKVSLVLASDPDVVELEIDDLVLREVRVTESRIEGSLASEDPMNQIFPGHNYDPRSFQGIY